MQYGFLIKDSHLNECRPGEPKNVRDNDTWCVCWNCPPKCTFNTSERFRSAKNEFQLGVINVTELTI